MNSNHFIFSRSLLVYLKKCFMKFIFRLFPAELNIGHIWKIKIMYMYEGLIVAISYLVKRDYIFLVLHPCCLAAIQRAYFSSEKMPVKNSSKNENPHDTSICL